MAFETFDTFYTASPLIKRGPETFVEFLSVGGEQRRMEFTREIFWLQESETQILFLHGGKVIREGSTYNDFYGYLRSADVSDPSMDELAAAYGVTPESSLIIEATTSVWLRPVIETAETKAYNASKPNNYKHQFASLPRSWRTERTNEEGKLWWPALSEELVGKGVVWSSKNTPEENAVTLAAYKKLWAVAPEKNLLNQALVPA